MCEFSFSMSIAYVAVPITSFVGIVSDACSVGAEDGMPSISDSTMLYRYRGTVAVLYVPCFRDVVFLPDFRDDTGYGIERVGNTTGVRGFRGEGIVTGAELDTTRFAVFLDAVEPSIGDGRFGVSGLRSVIIGVGE